MRPMTRCDRLPPGVVKVTGQGSFRKRILEMGFVKGHTVTVVRNAPLLDPVEYEVLGAEIALHRHDADMIEVVGEHEAAALENDNKPLSDSEVLSQEQMEALAARRDKVIKVAFVGNPNCGKTSIYNALSGANEHVGNYSGVTVDAREIRVERDGYTFILVDLPGTYSLTAYTPEERYVRRYLIEQKPDIVLNVLDASNLERNLYLTTQLIDMDLRVVAALNMYDDLEKSGDRLDYVQLSRLLGIPMVPTVGKSGLGLSHLLHLAVILYERGDYAGENDTLNPAILREIADLHEKVKEGEQSGKDPECSPEKCASCPVRPSISLRQIYHHVHVNHGITLERAIKDLQQVVWKYPEVRREFSSRYIAIKLLENNSEVEKDVLNHPGGRAVIARRDELAKDLERKSGLDAESMISDAKYAFIAGALRETMVRSDEKRRSRSLRIDDLLTNRFWGYPVFLLFMFVMFECTFVLGAYPQEWIESGIASLSAWLGAEMPAGAFRDMVTDGVLGGVGAVLSFVPNIIILYLFISLMEDSGYMARAAFLMDRIMHTFGLHGRSFIPMLMGFGCTVPAVMACRTIEDRRTRIITILITPFMSCTARLPLYILIIGAFFPDCAAPVLFCLYISGIVMAAIAAKFLSSTVFPSQDIPFIIELPPYRMPGLKVVAMHAWSKCYGYLKKLGGIVLIASLIVWALGYFPRGTEGMTAAEQQENSYIGRISKAAAPVMEPLGFTWQMTAGLVTGLSAKELVVSTLGVLYPAEAGEDADSLGSRLNVTPAAALAFMVFVLIYMPCISAFAAIAREAGPRYAAAQAIGSTLLAWICAFAVFRIASAFL